MYHRAMLRAILVSALLFGCNQTQSTSTDLSVENKTTAKTTVYVSFGADSKITADDWAFCSGSGLSCNFDLAANASFPLPNPKGLYINATFAFGQPVACGVTKAEININNPAWYDTLDVSLVDGYSNKIQVVATPDGASPTPVILGPPQGKDGNEGVFGLFPYGCDICVDRENPPCGIPTGQKGCKAGTQYDPKPPCQFQGPQKGGGGEDVKIQLL